MSALNVMSIKRLLGMPLTFTFTDFTQITDVTPGTALANKAVVLDGSKGISTITSATITTLTSTTVNAGTISSTAINIPQTVITSGAVTKNTSATYSDVTGLAATVVPGTYKFRAVLPSTVASGTGGIKYAFNYTTAVLASIEATSKGYTASAVAVQHSTTTTAQSDLFTQAAIVILTEIEGTMVVSTGGTVTVQVAQNTSNASNTIALVGGTFELIRTV